MKIVCAWCKKTIKEGPDKPVSHGMCPACYKKFKASGGKYKGVTLREDYEGIRGGQGKTGKEVATRTDAVTITLAVLAGIGIILAFIQAIF